MSQALLQRILSEAFLLQARKRNGELPDREIGFHASSAGSCIRRVICELMWKHRKPMADTVKNILDVGTLHHADADEAIRNFCKEQSEGKLIYIAPWRTYTFRKSMTEAFTAELGGDTITTESIDYFAKDLELMGVYGTPDLLLVLPEKETVFFADLKFTNERSFGMKQKGNRSKNYELQIGTYLPSVERILAQTDWSKFLREGHIVYFSNSNRETVVHSERTNLLVSEAETYWCRVARAMAQFCISNRDKLPDAIPEEKWQCNYCSLMENNKACSVLTTADQWLTFFQGTEPDLFKEES